MTHPTKAIFYTLMCDFANLASDSELFTREDVDAAMKKIEVIDFEQTITVDGIKVGRTARCWVLNTVGSVSACAAEAAGLAG